MTSLSCKLEVNNWLIFQTDTEEDTILIWNLWESKYYGARRLIREFSDKNWKRRVIKKFVKKGAQKWFSWSYRKWQTTHIPQLCGAAWSSHWLMVQLTNGQHIASLCLSQRRTFWTLHCDYQFVFSVLDELYVSHHAWCIRCCSNSAL